MEYDELVEKIIAIDNSELVKKKTGNNAKIKDIKDKIPDITNLPILLILMLKLTRLKRNA